MYKLIEIESGFDFKTYSFRSGEKLCSHLVDGKLTVVFGTSVPRCCVHKCYMFKDEATMKTYFEIFEKAMNTTKSIHFVADLFEKLHSKHFAIFNFSDNQNKLSNDTY